MLDVSTAWGRYTEERRGSIDRKSLADPYLPASCGAPLWLLESSVWQSGDRHHAEHDSHPSAQAPASTDAALISSRPAASARAQGSPGASLAAGGPAGPRSSNAGETVDAALQLLGPLGRGRRRRPGGDSEEVEDICGEVWGPLGGCGGEWAPDSEEPEDSDRPGPAACDMSISDCEFLGGGERDAITGDAGGRAGRDGGGGGIGGPCGWGSDESWSLDDLDGGRGRPGDSGGGSGSGEECRPLGRGITGRGPEAAGGLRDGTGGGFHRKGGRCLWGP